MLFETFSSVALSTENGLQGCLHKKIYILQSLDKTEKIIIKMVSFLAIVVEPHHVKKMVKD